MKRKGAIELSANFLVVIFISAIIVIGGLALFFKLKANAENYVESINSQTEDRLRSMMLSNGARVAVYPSELTLSPGDGEAVGLGVTNILNGEKTFNVAVSVTFYADSNADGDDVISDDFFKMLSPSIDVPQGSQVVKSILLKIPKGEAKGQYVYTITVKYTEDIETKTYDTVQVYVNVP
jgi:hypothetical protein